MSSPLDIAVEAAQKGDLDKIKELLDGDILIKNSKKLHDQLASGITNYGELDHDDYGALCRLLRASSDRGQADVLRHLLQRYPLPTMEGDGGWIVDNVITCGSVECLQILIDRDPNLPKLTFSGHINEALWGAISHWNRASALGMTELLLKHGAGPHTFRHINEMTPIERAIALSEFPEMRTLLEQYGARCDDDGYLLATAAAQGFLASVRRMVEGGAHVDAWGRRPGNPGTPLQNAVAGRNLDVVEYLLGAGADVNKPSVGGRTPLFQAVTGGWLDGARVLVRAGADPTQPSVDGRTPLEEAEGKGDADILKLLRSV
ncbi:hypothetical protein GTA08_BOTSDO06010 [Botryosphaeria dothidea]|uniref:Ankyrin repeat protein n=1 Tax=Botryosphaeria dothidea TaxID=55169 RepID=A0A8H4N153_9PEZI|nr:hypothetical protein GTA08_BOTSDO06010 [Botryosphaeria dothidea]